MLGLYRIKYSIDLSLWGSLKRAELELEGRERGQNFFQSKIDQLFRSRVKNDQLEQLDK